MSIFHKKSNLSQAFVEANKRAIAAAMEGSEETFNEALGAQALVGPEMRGYLFPFHTMILTRSLTGCLGTYSDVSNNRSFLDQALGGDGWQARRLNPEISEVLLMLKRFSEVAGFPIVDDHIEYAGRVMPNMLLLIAHGFKHGRSQQYLWRENVDKVVSLYEGKAGRIASRRFPIKR